MSGVEAISFDEVECGKKVAESKKRYKWKFSINGKSYLLELAVSTLSGKRIVTLNSFQIYSQQSIFNIDFDYTHIIQGHSLRITRVPDFVNKFQMRIDNQSFEDIQNHKYKSSEAAQKKKYQYDPFADFGSVAKNTNPQSSNSNEFGDFDFDSFSAPAPNKPQQKPHQPAPKQADVFDFSAPQVKPPSSSNYETVNFQTNNFQTNAFGNFAQNFSKFDNDIDEGDFATNTFGKNNLYNDLVFQKPEEKSDWNQFEVKPQEKESGFFGDKFKIEMSAKQALNKVKRTAEEIKMKMTGQDESLI